MKKKKRQIKTRQLWAWRAREKRRFHLSMVYPSTYWVVGKITQHHGGKLPVHCSRIENEGATLDVCAYPIALVFPWNEDEIEKGVMRKAYKTLVCPIDSFILSSSSCLKRKLGNDGRSLSVQFLRNVPANYNGSFLFYFRFLASPVLSCVVITTSANASRHWMKSKRK